MGFVENLIALTDGKVFVDEPMKKHTTICVGGNAKYYVEPCSLYIIKRFIEEAKLFGKKYKFIGNGSNLLFSDSGFDGLVICLKNLNEIFFKPNCLRVMAGATISDLVKFCGSHGLGGVESLASIPATIGGAVTMNAGAFGHEISNHIIQVETLCDGKIKRYYKEECKFQYRKSRFLGGKELIVSVDFDFPKCESELFYTSIKNFTDLRRFVQPTGRSFGSIFKNPKEKFAGALIEEAGLKGYRIGGAYVSDKHANFILTDKTATASDVYDLIIFIKDKVKNSFGIELVNEVEYIGNFDETDGRLSHTYNV